MQEDIPVYLFTGFLESGKTTFVQDIMQDDRFNSGEKTLLMLCEEGEGEYDVSKFAGGGSNVNIKVIDDENDLTEKNMKSWLKENKAERVVCEYNGMWSLGSLFNNMPQAWTVYQTFSFADYNTFKMYNQNMRQLVYEKIANCDTVVFNRVPRGFDMMEIHRLVRQIAPKVQIAYEYPDHETIYDDIKDPLPYDINAPIINIKDEDFATFYRDLTDDEEKYNGLTVRFKGIVAVEPKFGKNVFAIGRHIMTCCAADIQYYCVVAKADKPVKLRSRDWITLTATIKIEYHEAYRDRGPVLHVKEFEKCGAANPEVATF